MEKLDKVIAGLSECSRIPGRLCEKCPYWEFIDYTCVQALRRDALEVIEDLRTDNQRLREMWADATKKLSVACAERDFAANLAQAYGEFVEATLEKEVRNER